MYSFDFVTYYDKLTDNHSSILNAVHKLISLTAPKKRTIRLLELACGTGTILKTFPNSYDLYGLDISSDMIDLAKKKVPLAKLAVGDMTDFSFPEKFDVIICVFDSINHLVRFSDWEKVFRLASKHLAPSGIFIFDMNTPKRLSTLATFKPYVKRLNSTTVTFAKVSKIKKCVYQIQYDILEQVNSDNIKLIEENIEEATFEVKRVIHALRKYFSIEKMHDPFRKRVTKNTGRIFFACKNIR